MPMDSLEAIQAMLDDSPFIKNCAMTVTAVDNDAQSLTITMPLKPEFERIPDSGQFHGGPIAALIDTAGCFALVVLVDRGIPTINFRTDYLRPAINTDLRAVATVRRAGRTLGVADVDVYDNEDRLVAVGRGTFGL